MAPSLPAGDIPNRSFRRGAVSRPGWRPIQPARHDKAVSGGQAAPVRLRRNRALAAIVLSELGQKGKAISEYWHSGGLGSMVLADLDGDGREEIIATGVAKRI